MSYKEKPQLKLYKYENSAFVLQAIIDDYQDVSFERNLYQAGQFTITINFNIPNSQLFQRGLFVQFGNDSYDFGEILTITDSIGSDGKGSQIRTITGYDARYILKRRVIKNMNSNGLWVMTAKGELCLRNLVKDQCGSSAEAKRQLPINNTIPSTEAAIGKEYSVSEQFTNLYEVCKTIATQSEIGWRIAFNGTSLTLECYAGTDRHQTVQFSTNFDSLANGKFTDSSESFANTVYVGGKGQNDDRDIYEGENGTPTGLNRFESWDNQSSMTTEAEYGAEALSMLTQYGQTIQMEGNGLAKCPYIYKEQYDVGDIITVAFSGKSAVVQILSVTEHWVWGSYDLQFSFGKPQPTQSDQLQLMLRKIQSASNKTNSTDSVRWYTLPDETSMPKADVTYNTIGFVGNAGTGATFTLYLDNEKTGSKTYHVYLKQVSGTGKITLTTGKSGATNLVLNTGTYVAIIYVDENGNITSQGMTATSTIETGNNQPATSEGVKQVITEEEQNRNTAINNAINELDVPSVGGDGKYISAISETNGKISAIETTMDTTPTANSTKAVTSGGVKTALDSKADKVENAINGNLAGLDANGNLTDSGYKADDFVTKVLASSLPTDAVLHYSFDDVPDYPDGTAVYKKDNNFTDTTGWSGPATATISNRKLVLDGAPAQNKNYSATIPANSIIILKGTATKDCYIGLYVKYTNQSSATTLKVKQVIEGEEIYWILTVPETSTYIMFYSGGSWGISISQLYIGDGSYTTPIIDNANGQNNATNNGGFAVKGVSGRGAYFPSANQYATIPTSKLPAPTSNDDFSISIWLKKDMSYVGDTVSCLKGIVRIGTSSGCFGLARIKEQIGCEIRDSVSSKGIYFNLAKGIWCHIVAVFNGITHRLRLYKDGVYFGQTSPVEANFQFGSNQTKWTIWGNTEIGDVLPNSDNQPATIDDLLIFDRALTETEVQALYQNKANTPKYYDLSDYKLKEVKENAQPQTLATPITIGGQSYTTVESALQALAGLV